MAVRLLASLAAAPLLAMGGDALAGWTTVALTGVQVWLAATLPVSMRTRRPYASRPRDHATRDTF